MNIPDELLFVIAVLLAIRLFFYEHRQYWIDSTRQEIFRIRDDLFDAAIEKGIPFDHPAYGMTRQTMNSLIRLLPQITIPQVITMYLIHNRVVRSRRADDYVIRRREAMRSLPHAAQRVIIMKTIKVHIALIRYLLHVSPLTWPFVVVLKPLMKLFIATKKRNRLTNRAGKYAERLDGEITYLGGKPEFVEP